MKHTRVDQLNGISRTIHLEEGSGGEQEESQWVYKTTFFHH